MKKRNVLLFLIFVINIFFTTVNSVHAVSVRHDLTTSKNILNDSDYPALVDLFKNDCMATLISEYYLLTVAHCTEDLRKGKILRVNGHYNKISKIIAHPKWDDENDKNDIGLIRLKQPVKGLDPIALHPDILSINTSITIIGRGVNSNGLRGEALGKIDGKLRKVTNKIEKISEDFYIVNFNRPGQAGITDLEGVGLAGDSGGPVFIYKKNRPYLVGLNSNGYCDHHDDKVGLYGCKDLQTKIFKHLNWIKKVTSKTLISTP